MLPPAFGIAGRTATFAISSGSCDAAISEPPQQYSSRGRMSFTPIFNCWTPCRWSLGEATSPACGFEDNEEGDPRSHQPQKGPGGRSNRMLKGIQQMRNPPPGCEGRVERSLARLKVLG